jgi:diguanylate cyclase (GGDEF)-like protein
MEKSVTQNQFIVTRYFLIIFLAVGSILAGMISLLYNLETKDYITRLEIEEQATIKLQAELITQNLKDIFSDLLFLSRQNELAHMLESADERFTEEIAREYLAFSQQKGKYDQIRFIDNTGMEKVRINFNNGNPAILPDSDLTPKGDRYYFKDTMALTQDNIFVSPFDLNIEKGKIEEPLKPMIRFGVPIFNMSKEKRGAVILNFLGNRLISFIREADQLSTGDLMLVNSNGYWLYSPNKADEWGFMLPERANRKFSLDFPESWKNMLSADVSQIHNEKGLFTTATIYPLQEGSMSSSGSNQASGDSQKSVKVKEYYWKIISYIPTQRLHTGTRGLLVKLFFLAMSLFLFTGIPSWFIAKLIVKRKMHQVELYRSANYDKLTELPNRSLFMDRLNQISKQSQRYQRKFALLFIDLDGFKSVNDTYGHDVGDILLINVAEKLLECVRDSDTVARLGGDEFTIILSTIETPENAESIARKIVTSLCIPFDIGGHEIHIGASIGISVYPEHGKNKDILLKKADDAMYLAKKEGKNDCRMSEI